MSLTLMRPTFVEFCDEVFEDELLVEMRLAELVIALTGCPAKPAFRLVRRTGDEQPLDRLARALATIRRHTATSN